MAAEYIAWIDADGNELALNDWGHYACTRDKAGVWTPPYTLNTSRMPLSEGAQLNGVITEQRGVDLNQMVRADSHDALVVLIRDLAKRMDPTRGPGMLKIGSGADARLLNCYPEGIKNLKDFITSASMVLSVLAIDPFWYAANATEVLFSNSGPTKTFFGNPFFPIYLLSSTVYAQTTVTNPGDVESYPVWTIRGPGDTVRLVNQTSGKTLNLGANVLAAGQTLVIDTRPGVKTILLDGVNVFSWLDVYSSLWPLEAGDNSLMLQINNASLASSIQLDFTARYNSR